MLKMEVLGEQRKTILFLALAGLFVLSSSFVPTHAIPTSSELNVREYSPLGKEGGAVIPASCPSFAHVSGECTPPTFSGSGGGSSGTSLSINNGDAVSLSWSCPSAYNTSSSGLNFSTGGALSGSQSVSPSATTQYALVCNNTGTSASVTVTVFNPSLTISASPTRVRAGNASTITWSASSVDSCTVTGTGVSANGISGSRSTGPLSNQSTYTLSCVTEGGSVSASVTVNLVPSFIEI